MQRLGPYFIAFFLLASSAFGRSVEAWFHPFDPTLERIAAWILSSDESIDIAMYSLEFTAANPAIKALQSPQVQGKIQAGSLKIRMIYEGYLGSDDALAMSRDLEALGVDVRFLASGRKVHHKFALFDYGKDAQRLVSGSANWSLTSYRNYNESILFVEDEPALIQAFQDEFNLLWGASEEAGRKLRDAGQDDEVRNGESIKAFFNSSNFLVSGPALVKNEQAEGYTLTRKIVAAIDQAQHSIKIASTRIQLRPIYDALIRAAARGISLQILVNMDQYAYKAQRKTWKLSPCPDAYEKSCSTGINFSSFLSEGTYPGREQVTLRIKFTDLNPRAFLAKQMHSKYLLVDDRLILSGSFNWSVSGEYEHLENLIVLDGNEYPEARQAFLDDFQRIYEAGRSLYAPFIDRLDQAFEEGQSIDCSFEPMSLSFAEIDYLLATGTRHDAHLGDVCL